MSNIFDKFLMDEISGKALKECLMQAAIDSINEKLEAISLDDEGYLTVNGKRIGKASLIGPPGEDGKPGKDGEDGKDGRSAFTQGTGISITSEGVINHSNSVTAATKGATTTTTAGATAGAVTVVGGVKYDAQGHITEVYTRNITLSNTTYTFSTLTFSEGQFSAGSFTATGGGKTIYIPTKTSHLELDTNQVANNTSVKDISTMKNFKSGVNIFVTGNDTADLPEGVSSKYGLIIIVKFADVNGFELFFEFNASSSTNVIHKRALVSGNWGNWSASNNSASASSLSLEDLKGVLTNEQYSSLTANIKKRNELAMAEEKAAMEAFSKSLAEMESAQAGEIGSGEISKPSKPSVEGNESI